ncbi:MAG TPA: hypothetical protein DCQ14_03980 [Firmicutes bacterium]|nr:hypothetical protein [Bacillota bacterium]
MDVQNAHDEAIRVLVEHYRTNMKMLIREGKFDHSSLEQQLSFVVGYVNEEIKKITENLIKEEETERKPDHEHYSFAFRQGDKIMDIKIDRIQFEAEYAPLENNCYSFLSTGSCEGP